MNASDTQGVKRSADATDPTGARGSPGNAAATASLAATGASEFAGSPDVDASLVGFGSTEGFDPIQSAFEPAPASADAAHGWHLSGASAVIEAQRLFSLSGAGLAGVPAARAGTSTVQGTDTVPTEVNSKVPENGGTRADMLPWASGGRTHRHPLEAGVSAEPSAAASSTRALRLDEPPRAVASEGFAWAAAAATTAAASASSASAIAAASAFAATGPNTGEVARPAVVDATSNNAAMGIHTAQDSPIGPEVGSPGFAPALGARMVWLARDGVESAQLQLNPAELGPVAVRLAIDGSQVRVDMVAEAAFTRQALEESLPALASALRDAGFTLAGGGVSQQSQGHAQDPRSPAAASNGQSISNDALATASPAAGAARLSAQRPQGLVDLFA